MRRFRAYRTDDRSACLALFDGNVPGSFLDSERDDFEAFLDERPGPYFVIESEGRVVACGGYAESSDGEAVDLCWGMVDADRQGRGLGRQLLEERIREARRRFPGRTVRMNTSQFTAGFFEKHGFRTVRVMRDGYAPGLDRFEMELF